jgi:hypothetical protein
MDEDIVNLPCSAMIASIYSEFQEPVERYSTIALAFRKTEDFQKHTLHG